MQGHIWTETVRTSEQLEEMVFPRIIAVAERAWHEVVYLYLIYEICLLLKIKR